MNAVDETTTLDKVIITDAVYDKLLLWGNSRNLNSVSIFRIKKPFIFFIIECDGGAYFEVDLSDDNLYGIKAYSSEKTILNDFEIVNVNGTDKLLKNTFAEKRFKKIFSNTDYDQDCGDEVYLVKCLLNYIAEYREERVRIRKEIQVKKQIKKTKKQTIKRKIKVGVYYINDYDEEESEVKTERQKHIDSWGVRGHWRIYKSGKKAWVTPYVKGRGAKDPKEYMI